jgi:TolA-binding protein
MLRHIGLATVIVALVTLTADTVHGRGGMRGHSTFRYNFGSGGYSAGDSYSGGSSTVSSHYRGSSGTSSRKSSKSAGNSLSSEETSSTSTSTGAIANVTKRGAGAFGSNTATTQQTAATTTPVSSTPPSSTQTQPLVANTPLGLTPTLGIPLSQDPNTSADRNYRGLLHNAKQLIKAGVYPPAINDLQRIINGAPGTRVAAEAQRLLARIPTN